MPFRTKELLEEWLAEFIAEEHPMPGELEVLRHEDLSGGDTGLVVVRLKNAGPYAYLEPTAPGDPSWQVVFAPRHDELTLDVERLNELSEELVVAAELCSFLEQKSREHLAAVPAAVPAAQ
ncbi:hypothetical protein [Herbiconiux flava]|uniref:Uncharacterized protein n=1 Tax=Herbiconiux flava TaxID=881268 RepID=A0A852SJU8_9MICO|nr:hypothetical protein [Herbiconiux flava]NYD69820.1 hypothetical protein [Herbiconiux flava]GLK16569.1 hypothetical protein GCM10017602_10510 [Herbiconiux flava]